MPNSGYCYAYRSTWTHPAFKDFREAAIWNYLYQNAHWQDSDIQFNGQLFQLKRGQIVVSISYLAKGFCMTDKGVRVVIQKLQKHGMLGKQGTSKGTILTICNYDDFQELKKTEGEQEGKRRANGGQTEGNVINRSKLSNKGKKEKKTSKKKPAVSLDELSVNHIMDWLSKKRLEGKYIYHDEADILEVFKNYCLSKGKRYVDYVAAYRNAFEWERCQPKTNGFNRSGAKQTAHDAFIQGAAAFIEDTERLPH
jgi:hypothetical protein